MDLQRIIDETWELNSSEKPHNFEKAIMKEAIRQALEEACKANNSRLFNYPTIEDFEDGYNQSIKDSNKDIIRIVDEL